MRLRLSGEFSFAAQALYQAAAGTTSETEKYLSIEYPPYLPHRSYIRSMGEISIPFGLFLCLLNSGASRKPKPKAPPNHRHRFYAFPQWPLSASPLYDCSIWS